MTKTKIKYFIIGGAALVIIALVTLSLININKAQTYSTTQNTNNLGSSVTGNEVNGAVQEVRLYMKDFNYVTEPTVLTKGVPVRMTVDLKTVVGCATDVVIKDFNVRKAVRSGDNIIEFTPTKIGTIAIACSMNMFHGTFTVVDEANPNAPAEVTSSPVTQAISGSCGMHSGSGGCAMASSGGCGCGKKL